MIAALLVLLTGLPPAAAQAGTDTFDPLSRHAAFALACGRALRAGNGWVRPKLSAAGAWTTPKITYVVDHSKALAEYAAGVMLEGSYADRLAHNRMVILQTPSDSTDAGELVLKTALRELYPEWARNVRILYRDHEMILFVKRDVKATIFPPRTPVLVRRVDMVVEGPVSRDVLERLVRHARRGS